MQATVADPRLSSTDALNLCGLWCEKFPLASSSRKPYCICHGRSTLFSRTRATTGSAVPSRQRGECQPCRRRQAGAYRGHYATGAKCRLQRLVHVSLEVRNWGLEPVILDGLPPSGAYIDPSIISRMVRCLRRPPISLTWRGLLAASRATLEAAARCLMAP
jgi:hypothetical protein